MSASSTRLKHSSSVIRSPRFIITFFSSDLEMKPLPSWKYLNHDLKCEAAASVIYYVKHSECFSNLILSHESIQLAGHH